MSSHNEILPVLTQL